MFKVHDVIFIDCYNPFKFGLVTTIYSDGTLCCVNLSTGDIIDHWTPTDGPDYKLKILCNLTKIRDYSISFSRFIDRRRNLTFFIKDKLAKVKSLKEQLNLLDFLDMVVSMNHIRTESVFEALFSLSIGHKVTKSGLMFSAKTFLVPNGSTIEDQFYKIFGGHPDNFADFTTVDILHALEEVFEDVANFDFRRFEADEDKERFQTFFDGKVRDIEKFTYEIVHGKDIIEAYAKGPHTCMLSKSDGVPKPGLQFFVDNPTTVSLVKIINSKNKYIGRALLWNTVSGKKILDRIYPSDKGDHTTALREYAVTQGWDFKTKDTYGSQLSSGEVDHEIEMQYDKSYPLPYMDSFRLTNDIDCGTIRLALGFTDHSGEGRDLNKHRSEKYLLNNSEGELTERIYCKLSGWWGQPSFFVQAFIGGEVVNVHKEYASGKFSRIAFQNGNNYYIDPDELKRCDYTGNRWHVSEFSKTFDGKLCETRSTVQLLDGTLAFAKDERLKTICDVNNRVFMFTINTKIENYVITKQLPNIFIPNIYCEHKGSVWDISVDNTQTVIEAIVQSALASNFFEATTRYHRILDPNDMYKYLLTSSMRPETFEIGRSSEDNSTILHFHSPEVDLWFGFVFPREVYDALDFPDLKAFYTPKIKSDYINGLVNSKQLSKRPEVLEFFTWLFDTQFQYFTYGADVSEYVKGFSVALERMFGISVRVGTQGRSLAYKFSNKKS